MQIRDKLIIIAVLPIVLVLNLGVIQYRNATVIAQLNEKARIADDIFKKLSMLNQLTIENNIYHEERIHLQWVERHTDIGKQLETVTPLFNDKKEQNIIDKVKQGHRTIGYLFGQFDDHDANDRAESTRSKQFARIA